MWALLLACTTEDSAAPPPPFCESDLHYKYDPDAEFATYPDDWWTVPDSTTRTGLRVSMPRDEPAMAEFPPEYLGLLDQAGTLDGFGLSSDLVLRFDDDVPADAEVHLLAQIDGTWVEQEHSWSLIDVGNTILVHPWRPLPPASRGILAVKTDPAAEGCISPSATLRELLVSNDRYAEALAALGWAPEDVGAMSVFTTQSAEDVDAAVAADIATRSYTLDAPMTCTDLGAWRDCRGSLTVGDYRGGDRIVPAGAVAVQSTYALPMVAWLPDTPGPYPVILCGHGLGGSKDQCDFLPSLAAPYGFAVVAVDAQEHGEHPLRTTEGDSELDQIMALFGFTLDPPSLDAFVLRDNFRASAWDKLQVVAAIQAGMDVDGDGTVDLDPDHIEYAGASLGGIMGPELMAWAPGIEAGALAVPGGGLMNLVIDSDSFGIIAVAMSPDDWDEDDLARTIPMVQALIDAGDPLIHAAAMSRRRAAEPQADVALLMALDDTIVPNSSTAALAAAFEVEGVGRELLPMDGVPFGPGPLTGNLADGSTGAILEFDQTTPADGGEPEPADHSTLHESVEAQGVMIPFLEAVRQGQTPTITDPY